MLSARDIQVDRLSPRRDNHVRCLKNIIPYLNRRGSDEVRSAVESRDPGFSHPLFGLLGNGLGELTLESQQLRPINVSLLGANALVLHTTIPVDHLGGAHQYLFRITTAQSASAPERSGIDDCHQPSGFTAARGYHGSCCSGSDHGNIEL